MLEIKQKIRAYLRTNFKIFKGQHEERLVQNLPISEMTSPYNAVQEYKPPTAASIRVQSDLVNLLAPELFFLILAHLYIKCE